MARVDYPDPATLSAESQALLDQGAPLNLLRMMAYAPEMHRHYLAMGAGLLRRGVLDPELRELLILRVGHLANSPYEQYQHVAVARMMGMPE